MRNLIYLSTLFCVFFLLHGLKAQSQNDSRPKFDGVSSAEFDQKSIWDGNTTVRSQNFRWTVSENAEVLYQDKENQCKIFRSRIAEFKDDIYLVKNKVKPGMFYELDDLKNMITTTEIFEFENTKWIEIITYKSDKSHINLISLIVV